MDPHPDPQAALEAALAPLDGCRLLVGYSGGLDSTVLLHALAGRRGRLAGLRALHVHHGLQAGADAWAAHCVATGAALDVEVAVARVTVLPAGEGPEAAARRARHAAFAAALGALGAGEDLVLAHHRDDQAETVLLRLLRGGGSEGLAGMRAERGFGPGRLLRPLLGLPRATLEAWARARGLAWVEDPSNDRLNAERNRLRHGLLPALARDWPAAGANLARSAGLLAEDAALLADEARRRAAALRAADGSLSLAPLLDEAPAWRARILRQWLLDAGLPPPPATAHARLDTELLQARRDGRATLRWPGAQVRRWRDRLYASAPPVQGNAPGEAPWRLDWDGRGWLTLPDRGRLAFLRAGDDGVAPAPPFAPFVVARRAGGERLRLPGRTHRHALKHLLQDAALPPWQRARLPLLFAADGELLSAGDALVGDRLAAWQAAQGARLHWQPARD